MSQVSNEVTQESEPKLKYSFWAGALLVRGSVTPRVLPDIFSFGLIAFGIVLAQHVAMHNWGVSLAIPVGPFEAVGAVLGLLLVLRTSSGYDRWWEARKLWGGIVNQSRALGTQAVSYVSDDGMWQRRFIRLVAALPYAIRNNLRGRSDSPELVRLIGGEAGRVITSRHGPGVIFVELARMLKDAVDKGLHPNAFHNMEENRRMLLDHVGGCERIRTTPLARSSAIQVKRFIFMFLVSLPFALLRQFQYEEFATTVMGMQFSTSVFLVPIFVMLVSYPLLSLDRIGMELQNPFDPRRLDHLPLDRICETIEKNLAEVLGVESLDHEEADTEMLDLGKKTRHPFASETYIS
ncbi:MAG: hypothetical protein GY758_06880 [Fuerstiella sp.]|nr:hypothetical protein [Fuerstiella sp.]MCP4509525.1 hypothetical protein [Fuerstiella sp.]MDG2128136.1 bestrophin family ion channel [Fuerstiella sp.]